MNYEVFQSLDTPIFWLRNGIVEWMNKSAKSLLHLDTDSFVWEDVYPKLPAGYVFRLHDERQHGFNSVLVECVPDTNPHLLREIEQLRAENSDLERILEASLDEVFVTNAEGVTVRVNETAEQLYGMPRSELIGKSVFELEQQGVFYPSVISIVLQEKRRITILQRTSSGQTLIATANPVFDELGNLVQVVSNAKDITDVRLDGWMADQLKPSTSHQHPLEPTATLVAESDAMKQVLELAGKVAATDATVLILGETGAGKNRLAEYIHQHSARADKAFVSVDCASIPETLVESELFGYERGAFTGANKAGKSGKVELADEGTLFLDEIGELPLSVQGKLLDFVQRRTFTRVGGTRPNTVNTRLITATNRDLWDMVRNGTFRADLYYRLNVIPMTVPPLRCRAADIPKLASSLLRRFSMRHGVPEVKLSPEAHALLLTYEWAGNVRELENVLERISITSPSPLLSANDLRGYLPQLGGPNKEDKRPQDVAPAAQHAQTRPSEASGTSLRERVDEFERSIFADALARHRSTYAIAKALDVSQPTVVRKLKQYRLKS